MEATVTLMTIKDVSNYTKIKEKTIYAKVESKQIPSYRIGRLIRFKKEEIDEWISSQYIGVNGDVPKSRSLIKSKATTSSVDRIIRKIIDQESRGGYTSANGKSDRIKGPKQEINNGSI